MLGRILFIALSLFIVNAAYAQKIKLKKEIIYLDGNEFLSYAKKTHGTEFVVYELNTKNELFTGVFYAGNTEIRDDNYYRLIFLNEDMSMEYTRPYWNKSLITWLLEQDVLTTDGKINQEKLESFIKKYDENVQERTIRVN